MDSNSRQRLLYVGFYGVFLVLATLTIYFTFNLTILSSFLISGIFLLCYSGGVMTYFAINELLKKNKV